MTTPYLTLVIKGSKATAIRAAEARYLALSHLVSTSSPQAEYTTGRVGVMWVEHVARWLAERPRDVVASGQSYPDGSLVHYSVADH
jgi:hypothetical protein